MKIYYKTIHVDSDWKPIEYTIENEELCCKGMKKNRGEACFGYPRSGFSIDSPNFSLGVYGWGHEYEYDIPITHCPFCGTKIEYIKTGVYKEEKTVHHVMEKVEKVERKLVKVND